MIVVVDTNILFSACLTPQGRIFEILFNTPSYAQLISGHYAIEELSAHKGKLSKLSKLPTEKLDVLISVILKQIDFYHEETIESRNWEQADHLTKEVDSKDIVFVALSLQTNAFLWTGDKKLTAHLKAMGFDRVVDTNMLYELFAIG
jgi:predicted nucleic acid-binding protein